MSRAPYSRFVFACTWAIVASLVACGASSSPEALPSTDPSQPSGPEAARGPDVGSEAGAPPVEDAPPPSDDDIQIIVEPTDKAQALLTAIDGAKSSIHMTMYLLDDSRFVSALIARHQAGVDVKVLLNQKFPSGAGTNQATFQKLQAAGVNVKYAPSTFTLTHEKCVVIDEAHAWIMTMNLAGSSPSNREYLALDDMADDVAEAEAIFAADFAGTPLTPTGALVVAPTNATEKLVALLASAKTTIDLEGEELSDKKIVSALIEKKAAGLSVRAVIADNPLTSAQSSAVSDLKAANIPIVKVAKPYIHAKAVVVDGSSAYVGSENFTTASLVGNRELGIITHHAPSVTSVATTIAKDFQAGTPL